MYIFNYYRTPYTRVTVYIKGNSLNLLQLQIRISYTYTAHQYYICIVGSIENKKTLTLYSPKIINNYIKD